MPAGQPGGRAWGSRGPIPTSPFLVLRLQEGQMSWALGSTVTQV